MWFKKSKPEEKKETERKYPSCKIILTNNTDENVTAELFNKKNGVDIGGAFKFKGLDLKVIISSKVITTIEDKEYEQSYADFFECVQLTPLIITGIKSSNNSQVTLFTRDVLKNKITASVDSCASVISGEIIDTLINIELLPKQTFEMEFKVTGKAISNQTRNFVNLDQNNSFYYYNR